MALNELTAHHVYTEVVEERRHQDRLRLAGKIPRDVSDPSCDEYYKLSVLMEEVGEVAMELNDYGTPKERPRDAIYKELVQVAAVTFAWLEALEHEKEDGV